MLTETKGLTSIDEAFNEGIDEELAELDIEKVEDKTETPEKVEVVEEEKTEVVEEEKPKEEVVEEVVVEKEPESKVDWKSIGLPMFDGKTQEEVAKQIKGDRTQLGHTVNMIGDLRREMEALKKPKEVKEVVKPKDFLADIKDLDEADTAKFNTLYEKNPVKAIMTYGSDAIKQMVADEVKKSVPDVTKTLQQTKENIEYDAFLALHADITDVDMEQMKIFDDKQWLGEQGRPYTDLYGLATLWRNKDERAESVFMLMKKHPTVTFSEACNLLPENKVESPVVNKEKIVETVNKNKKTNTKSHTPQASESIKKVMTVDEAFED